MPSGHLQTGYAAVEEFIEDDVVVYDRLGTRAIPSSDVTLLTKPLDRKLLKLKDGGTL
jgi:hypothetical protein